MLQMLEPQALPSAMEEFPRRDEIAETVKGFLKLVRCQEPEVLDLALDTYGGRSLDFVDCVLYGYHAVNGAEIATFDKKLLKLLSAPSE